MYNENEDKVGKKRKLRDKSKNKWLRNKRVGEYYSVESCFCKWGESFTDQYILLRR